MSGFPALQLGLFAAAGFFALALVVVGWMFFMDNLAGWYRQTIQWPSAYRCGATPLCAYLQGVIHACERLNKAGLAPLAALACAGCVAGWLKGPRPLVVLLAAWMAAEMCRNTLESWPWMYLVSGLLPPMILASSMTALILPKPLRTLCAWLLPVVALAHPLWVTAAGEGDVLRWRVLERTQTPMEQLAAQMRMMYQSGETVFVTGNDMTVPLILNAPRPYPLLALHYPYVPEREQDRAAVYHLQHPPKWIIDRDPARSAVGFSLKGSLDDLCFRYAPGTEGAGRKGFKEGDLYAPPEKLMRDGQALLMQGTYRLAADIGYAQAWRRNDSADEDTVQSQSQPD